MSLRALLDQMEDMKSDEDDKKQEKNDRLPSDPEDLTGVLERRNKQMLKTKKANNSDYTDSSSDGGNFKRKGRGSSSSYTSDSSRSRSRRKKKGKKKRKRLRSSSGSSRSGSSVEDLGSRGNSYSDSYSSYSSSDSEYSRKKKKKSKKSKKKKKNKKAYSSSDSEDERKRKKLMQEHIKYQTKLYELENPGAGPPPPGHFNRGGAVARGGRGNYRGRGGMEGGAPANLMRGRGGFRAEGGRGGLVNNGISPNYKGTRPWKIDPTIGGPQPGEDPNFHKQAGYGQAPAEAGYYDEYTGYWVEDGYHFIDGYYDYAGYWIEGYWEENYEGWNGQYTQNNQGWNSHGGHYSEQNARGGAAGRGGRGGYHAAGGAGKTGAAAGAGGGWSEEENFDANKHAEKAARRGPKHPALSTDSEDEEAKIMKDFKSHDSQPAPGGFRGGRGGAGAYPMRGGRGRGNYQQNFRGGRGGFRGGYHNGHHDPNYQDYDNPDHPVNNYVNGDYGANFAYGNKKKMYNQEDKMFDSSTSEEDLRNQLKEIEKEKLKRKKEATPHNNPNLSSKFAAPLMDPVAIAMKAAADVAKLVPSVADVVNSVKLPPKIIDQKEPLKSPGKTLPSPGRDEMETDAKPQPKLEPPKDITRNPLQAKLPPAPVSIPTPNNIPDISGKVMAMQRQATGKVQLSTAPPIVNPLTILPPAPLGMPPLPMPAIPPPLALPGLPNPLAAQKPPPVASKQKVFVNPFFQNKDKKKGKATKIKVDRGSDSDDGPGKNDVRIPDKKVKIVKKIPKKKKTDDMSDGESENSRSSPEPAPKHIQVERDSSEERRKIYEAEIQEKLDKLRAKQKLKKEKKKMKKEKERLMLEAELRAREKMRLKMRKFNLKKDFVQSDYSDEGVPNLNEVVRENAPRSIVVKGKVKKLEREEDEREGRSSRSSKHKSSRRRHHSLESEDSDNLKNKREKIRKMLEKERNKHRSRRERSSSYEEEIRRSRSRSKERRRKEKKKKMSERLGHVGDEERDESVFDRVGKSSRRSRSPRERKRSGDKKKSKKRHNYGPSSSPEPSETFSAPREKLSAHEVKKRMHDQFLSESKKRAPGDLRLRK